MTRSFGIGVLLITLLANCTGDDTGNTKADTAWQCGKYGCSDPDGRTNQISGTPRLNTLFPTTIAYGQNVSIQLLENISPLHSATYSLKYGPNGFSVSPTGVVSWNGQDFMFDSSMDFNWGIDVFYRDSTYSFSGKISVLNPVQLYPLSISGIAIPKADHSMSIHDFDHDGKNEIVTTDNIDKIQILKFNSATNRYSVHWQFPYAISEISSLSVFDVNADGHPDIIVSAGKKLIVIDGKTRRNIKELDVASFHRACQAADLENNGQGRLVCATRGDPTPSAAESITIYELPSFKISWRSSETHSGVKFDIGDIDADSNLEIVSADGYVIDGVTHSTEWFYPDGFGWMTLGNVTGDIKKEIIGFGPGTVSVYDGKTKNRILYRTTNIAGTRSTTLNVDADIYDEIIVAPDQWGNVSCIGDILTGDEQLWSINPNIWGSNFIYAGDADNDGKNDIVIASGNADQLYLIDSGSPTGIKFSTNSNDTFSGPFYGGLLARTASERRAIFNMRGNGLRLLSLDPKIGTLLVSQHLSSASTITVTDSDSDGIDEIRAATTNGNIYIGETYYYFAEIASDSLVPTQTFSNMTSGIGAVGESRGLISYDFNRDGYLDFVVSTAVGGVFVFDAHNQSIISVSSFDSGRTTVNNLDINLLTDIAGNTTDITLYSEKFMQGGVMGGTIIPNQYGLEIFSAFCYLNSTDYVIVGKNSNNSEQLLFKVYSKDLATPKYDFTYSGFDIGDVLKDATDPSGYRIIVNLQSNAVNPEYFIASIDVRNGKEIWRSAPLDGLSKRKSIRFADINGDGKLKLIYGTSRSMNITR